MFKRLKAFANKHKKAIVGLTTIACLTMAMSAMAFATDGSGTATTTTAADIDVSTLVTALNSAADVQDIIRMFVQVVGLCIPFVLGWYFCRWLYSKFKKAITGRER